MSKLLRIYTSSYERSPYLTLLCTNALLMGLGDISAQTLALTSTSLNELEPAVWDIARTARFAAYGGAVGPLAGKWFQFLDTRFPLHSSSSSSSSKLSANTNTTTGPISSSSRFEELKNPIPGMQLPKGSRLERGTGGLGSTTASSSGIGGGGVGAEKASVMALIKRVAADQLGMAPAALFLFLFSMAVLEGLDRVDTIEKITSNFLPILLVNWKVWPLLQLINFRYIPLRYRLPFGSVCGIVWTAYLSTQIEPSREEVLVES